MENINDYKALAFFDLDGTLLNAKSQLDEEVIAALHQLRKNGILPFIATGRGHFELKKLMDQAGITGAIAMNGQYILLDGQPIYKESIPTSSIQSLLKAAATHEEALAFYDQEGYWLNKMNDFARNAYAYTHAPLPPIDPNYFLDTEVNMLLVLSDQPSHVAYYKAEVPELNFFKNSLWSIDVTNISTNKGTGVAHVKEILGFKGETFAFGDGPNDLDLLSAADHKTAMGNAVPELKEMADFVSTKNTERGIITAFNHWGLL